MGAKLGFSR